MSSRIAEVLSVLRLIRTPSPQALSLEQVRRRRLAAAKYVARDRGITHETVRDACTRQLEPHIRGIAEFDEMVRDWVAGDGRELRAALLQHTVDVSDSAAVDRFFDRIS